MNDKYINMCKKLAYKAYKKGEVPVGCVIVDTAKNKIISCGYNCKERKNNSLNHAELIAIKKACKKKKTWRLDDCVMYTTLQPCMMCAGAIIESRIKKLIYGTKSYNMCNVDKLYKNAICLNDNECSHLLTKFFKKIRTK